MKLLTKKFYSSLFLLLIIVFSSFTWTLPVSAQFIDLCQYLGIGCSATSPIDRTGQQGPNQTTTTTPANSGSNNNGGNNGTTSTPLAVPNTLGFTNLADIVNQLSVYIIPFAVIGFIGCVIYSGYIRLFSAGDVNGEKKSVVVAKSAAIGFAIIFFANLFLLLLSNILKLSAV